MSTVDRDRSRSGSPFGAEQRQSVPVASPTGAGRPVTDLRAATRAYLVALATATAAVTVIALLRTDSPELRDGLLAVAFCGLQVLTVSFPIALGPQQKLSLHTVVVFAAVLLFDPGVAVLIV